MAHVIRNARVLHDDFLPKEVVHRHDEVNQLSKALEPVIEGDRPQDAFLVGPSGAGKTCIARYTVDKLQEKLLDVESHYVDCWQHSNRFRVLYKILEGVGTSFDVHRSTPHDEMLARVEALETPYVIILDEVDQLEDADVLRELYAIPQLTVVLIANREREVVATLDERLQSRLRSSEIIRFDQYSDAELVAILSDRIRWGLAQGAITDAQVERIADAAAGNARDAISILRSAARNAEHEGVGHIRDADVEMAIPSAREQLRQKTVEKLTEDQTVIYDIITEQGECSPNEIYEAYADRVADPKTQRTVRTYLQKLAHYNLVEGRGSGPSRTYEPKRA
jgi:orc1/cdc6 family replication initiation protein